MNHMLHRDAAQLVHAQSTAGILYVLNPSNQLQFWWRHLPSSMAEPLVPALSEGPQTEPSCRRRHGRAVTIANDTSGLAILLQQQCDRPASYLPESGVTSPTYFGILL